MYGGTVSPPGHEPTQGRGVSPCPWSPPWWGTDVFVVHEGWSPARSAVDSETGWRMASAKVAALVEGGSDVR